MAIKTRRTFLAAGASAFVASAVSRLGLMRAQAQSPNDYKALVCIFLFGGNDGYNTVVPRDSAYDLYASIRGTLAIAKDELLPMPTRSGRELGLHPGLSSIHPLYASGRLAVVSNVGVLYQPTTREQYRDRTQPIPSNLFSHSDQQLQWQTSHFDSFQNSGWAGRAADTIASMNAPSAFPTAVSLSGNRVMLAGADTQPATIQPGGGMRLTGNGNATFRAAREQVLLETIQMDSGLAMLQHASGTLVDGLEIGKLINDALASAPTLQTTFPTTGLGRQLQEVARLVATRAKLGMRRQIFFTSIGGFDTHANQLTTHTNLLKQLSDAMSAPYQATEELGVADAVVTFTESEFGRTMQPSSSAGTDHAWGSPHLVLGGPVSGGDAYGRYPNLTLGGPDDAGSRGSYLPSVALDQYGATLATWFGVPSTSLDTVFPNLHRFPERRLGFL